MRSGGYTDTTSTHTPLCDAVLDAYYNFECAACVSSACVSAKVVEWMIPPAIPPILSNTAGPLEG